MLAKQAPGRFNTEEYKKIDENEFLAVANNPLSTFSIDVDTASYSNVRRFINDGVLPPKDAVRIEEMINYFKYDYPQPQGDEPFSVSTELADCPWNRSHKLVQIGLQGRNIDVSEAPPSNLVFLLLERARTSSRLSEFRPGSIRTSASRSTPWNMRRSSGRPFRDAPALHRSRS